MIINSENNSYLDISRHKMVWKAFSISGILFERTERGVDGRVPISMVI
jgi:hypothetical protein